MRGKFVFVLLLALLVMLLPVGATVYGQTTAASVVINEIDYDQPGGDTAEFVELYNSSGAAVNLDPYSLLFVNGGATGGPAPYTTVELPAVILAPSDYYVVCSNTTTVANCDLDVAPDTNLIQNGNPDAVALRLNGANVDTVSYGGNVLGYTEGTGAPTDTSAAGESIARCPDGSDTNNNSIDFKLLPSTPGATNCGIVVTPTNTAGTATATNTLVPPTETPVGPTETPVGPTETPVGPTETPTTGNVCEQPTSHFIWQVQGAGSTSPLVGQTVTVQGIVVGDFQEDADPDSADGQVFFDLDGFFLQEEQTPPDSDANPLTSDGIFVFARGGTNVQAGDEVRVTGQVAEFTSGTSSLTQLTNVSYSVCGQEVLPAPQQLSEPITDPAGYEQYEGMLVQYQQQLRISEYFNFDRFGEIVLCQPSPIDPLAEQDRLYQPTAIDEPASPSREARATYNAAACITLDDGRSNQNPDPARHPNGNEFTTGSDTDEFDGNRFRGGDIVEDTTGILDDRFSLYRIQPTQGATYTATNPRQPAPDPVGGSLRVASFNVLNYFTTFDTNPGSNNGPDICGPNRSLECRGANDQAEFERQRTKIIEALFRIDADIVGLIELENNPDDTALADLVAGLNARYGAETYDYIRTGPIGTDAIKVAFIYKPSTVTPVGSYQTLDSTDDPRFIDTRNRPALAQTFRENATNGIFTPVVNHLKSKGSGCGPGDDDPVQGNCNETRRLAAEALVDWLATDPTNSGDPDFLIIGDLNAYDKEEPIDEIRAGADDTLGTPDDYSDLEFVFQGEYAYSYLFDAQFGYLDYALAIQPLLPQVSGTTSWHINSDEPDIIDYDTSFKAPAQDELYEPNPYRSSDHDPVIVGLNLAPSQVTPTPTGATATATATSIATATNTPTPSTPTPTPGASDLVINEIDYDQPGGDTAEFVELYNSGTQAVNLDAYSLQFVNGANAAAVQYDIVDLPAVALAPGDYYVVCANSATVANCDLDDNPNTDFIQNGAPTQTGSPDALALLLNGQIVDTVSYEGNVPGYTEGTGATADPAVASESIARCPDGSDTNNNSIDFKLLPSTPGVTNCGIVVTPTFTNTPVPPTDTPTLTPTPSNTPVPPTFTNTPTVPPTFTNTPVPPTETPTPSNTPTVTETPSNTPTVTATPSNTPTVTATPSNTPTVTATPSNTPTVTNTPTPANTFGKATGSGQIQGDNGRITFRISAESDNKGIKASCTVNDSANDIRIKCRDATSYVQTGNRATFSGTATQNGVTTTYTIEVVDNGEPGSGRDSFTIRTGSGYTASGVLTSGNIQVQN